MAIDEKKIATDVDAYFTQKLTMYGLTPRGVDWNSTDSQEIRFKQLLKIIDVNSQFSINDLGCGFGALYNFLKQQELLGEFVYHGYDISQDMVNAAINKFSSEKNCFFYCDNKMLQNDYTVASGIFNVKMQYSEKQWEIYVKNTIEHMNEVSSKGFSFNILTSYSDSEYMRDDLYYANPADYFNYCKQRFSRNVALLHDYDLYDFTILVRK